MSPGIQRRHIESKLVDDARHRARLYLIRMGVVFIKNVLVHTYISRLLCVWLFNPYGCGYLVAWPSICISFLEHPPGRSGPSYYACREPSNGLDLRQVQQA
jgi:hypothetical protein